MTRPPRLLDATHSDVPASGAVIRIALDFLPPAVLRGNARPGHWAERARAAKALKRAALDRLDALDLPDHPFEQATVLYRAWCWGKGLDADSVVHGMKAALDAVVYLGLLIDDGPKHVLSVTAEVHRAESRDDVRVEMTVTEVADE